MINNALTGAAIHLQIQELDEGGFLATSTDVPGLIAEGRSILEAVEIAQDIARKIAESCIEHGDPLPPALAGMGFNRGSQEFFVPISLS